MKKKLLSLLAGLLMLTNVTHARDVLAVVNVNVQSIDANSKPYKNKKGKKHPKAPAPIWVEAVSSKQVNISWVDNVKHAVYYEVFRSQYIIGPP